MSLTDKPESPMDQLMTWLSKFSVWLLSVAALVWYTACLLRIGFWPANADRPPDGFYKFMADSLSNIGTALAGFVGVLLGLKKAAALAQAVGAGPNSLAKLIEPTRWQWLAAGLYVASLVVAAVCWGKDGDGADPAVVNLVKSVVGLLVGALAVTLKP